MINDVYLLGQNSSSMVLLDAYFINKRSKGNCVWNMSRRSPRGQENRNVHELSHSLKEY